MLKLGIFSVEKKLNKLLFIIIIALLVTTSCNTKESDLFKAKLQTVLQDTKRIDVFKLSIDSTSLKVIERFLVSYKTGTPEFNDLIEGLKNPSPKGLTAKSIEDGKIRFVKDKPIWEIKYCSDDGRITTSVAGTKVKLFLNSKTATFLSAVIANAD